MRTTQSPTRLHHRLDVASIHQNATETEGHHHIISKPGVKDGAKFKQSDGVVFIHLVRTIICCSAKHTRNDRPLRTAPKCCQAPHNRKSALTA